MNATQAQFDEAVAAYLAMEEAYGQLADGVYESQATIEADARYEAALIAGRLLDSEIVDYCYSM